MMDHDRGQQSETIESRALGAPSLEEVDVEAFAKESPDRPKPIARRYRIRIDREHFTVDVPSKTGREILALIGATPQTHKLYELQRGSKPRRVAPDESVDFRRPGVEKFQTIPCDQTEGGDAA